MPKKPKCNKCNSKMELDDEMDMGNQTYYGYICPKCKNYINIWIKKKEEKK